MPLHDDMSALLQELSAGSRSQPELAEGLEELLALAIRAVPRCLGLTLTIDRDGLPVTLTALTVPAAPDPVLGSLSLHLPRRTSSGTATEGARLTLYSGMAGAFERLRSDMLTLLDLDPRRVSTDADLVVPMPAISTAVVVAQLDDVTAVDRALGVLLDRGYLIDEGRSELDRRAADTGLTVPAVAKLLLDADPGNADPR